MLSRKQKIKEGFVGTQTFTDPETGEKITVNFDETPVFTREECERLNIGQPDMKPYSEMTEEERRVFDPDYEPEE